MDGSPGWDGIPVKDGHQSKTRRSLSLLMCQRRYHCTKPVHIRFIISSDYALFSVVYLLPLVPMSAL